MQAVMKTEEMIYVCVQEMVETAHVQMEVVMCEMCGYISNIREAFIHKE